MGPTWGPPGSCRPQMGPMLAQWTLLSGKTLQLISSSDTCRIHLWEVDLQMRCQGLTTWLGNRIMPQLWPSMCHLHRMCHSQLPTGHWYIFYMIFYAKLAVYIIVLCFWKLLYPSLVTKHVYHCSATRVIGIVDGAHSMTECAIMFDFSPPTGTTYLAEDGCNHCECLPHGPPTCTIMMCPQGLKKQQDP